MYFSIIKNKIKWMIVFCSICFTICGCSQVQKENFALLQNEMEKEDPLLSQESMEEQLLSWLNAYVYYEGGLTYEAPLLSYAGETIDYMVFHDKQWESDGLGFTVRKIYVLLQPRNKVLSTSILEFNIYDDFLYSMDEALGLPKERDDFSDLEAIKEEFSQLLQMSWEDIEPKMWYTGTLSVGKGEAPSYTDFGGKEEKVEKIYLEAKRIVEEDENYQDATIYIRNFNEHDATTEVLIESKDGMYCYVFLPYYFYQEDVLQPMDLEKWEHPAYAEKFKKMAIVRQLESESNLEQKGNTTQSQNEMEKEEPLLSQESMEAELLSWLNAYIYYEDGTESEAPLREYEGKTLDYVVFHNKQWESKKPGFVKRQLYVLLQPRNKTGAVSLLEFYLYDDSFYEISVRSCQQENKVDFSNPQAMSEDIFELAHFSMDYVKLKWWYTGTLTVGEVTEPVYRDFEGKDKQIDKIYAQAEALMGDTPMSEDATLYIRNFNEHDCTTEALLERKEEENSVVVLHFNFFQESAMGPISIGKENYASHIEKLKKAAIVRRLGKDTVSESAP